MQEHSLLFSALIFLLTAVICVPLARRIGLGSVLGYLLGGIVIGPWGLGLVSEPEDILHIAEFGVVLLLFLIGLELNPARLWAMRKPIIGAGGMQVLATTLILFLIALAMEIHWQTGLIAAMGLALSSTAIALQTLTEKNLLNTRAGSSGFSILLFQDIAIIPMLALLPLLGIDPDAQGDSSALVEGGKALAVIIIIVVGGHYLVRPVIRFIASTRSEEIFTAFSLLLVISTALLVDAVGLSMALGTFLAGVLLADSEYRHQLESELDPFKGLLLGLFFIAVGMSIDFGILIERPLLIFALLAILIVSKFLVLQSISRFLHMPAGERYFFSFLLAQGGEFAFVLFSVATAATAIDTQTGNLLIVVVALSMMTTPLLLALNDRLIAPRFARMLEKKPDDDTIDEHNPVIIAGFGRFGQIIARLIHVSKVATTVIDHSPEHIERVRRFGYKVFYGDATRMELLEAADIARARLLILAIDDWEGMVRIAHQVRHKYPHVRIMARAWDMVHAYQLMDAGVELIERDTFESALHLGQRALLELGFSSERAKLLTRDFKHHDLESFQDIYRVHKDEEQFISRSREAREDLEKLFESDEQDLEQQHGNTD